MKSSSANSVTWLLSDDLCCLGPMRMGGEAAADVTAGIDSSSSLSWCAAELGEDRAGLLPVAPAFPPDQRIGTHAAFARARSASSRPARGRTGRPTAGEYTKSSPGRRRSRRPSPPLRIAAEPGKPEGPGVRPAGRRQVELGLGPESRGRFGRGGRRHCRRRTAEALAALVVRR